MERSRPYCWCDRTQEVFGYYVDKDRRKYGPVCHNCFEHYSISGNLHHHYELFGVNDPDFLIFQLLDE